MQTSRISIFLLFSLLAIIVSCGEDPYSFPPPDFSTVPEPYDTTDVESVDLDGGVKTYIHDEGYGPFEITERDQVSIYLSLRTDTGEIIYSTFSSDRTDPIPVSMSLAGDIQNVFNEYTIVMTYTPGFEIGLLGMKQGEQRTIVVPPEQGFLDVPDGHINEAYRNNTLIYDVRVSAISPKKSR